MKNKRFLLGILVIVLGFSITGCVTRLGAFTIISTKNIDWSRASEFTRSNQHVEGEDMYHIIIFIPTKNIKIEDAIDNALKKVPGAIALVDAVLRSNSWYIPYIYGRGGYHIEGNILLDPKYAASVDEDSSNYLVFYTEDGKDFKKITVSEAEYLSYVK